MSKDLIPKIKTSTDYDSFIILDENRDVVKSHLLKLIKSISEKNFLHLFPIIINNKKEVIEGQHRLFASKELGVPIYYIVDNNIQSFDIAMVNSNRKAWKADDYIKFYAKRGNKSYISLSKFRKEFPKITIGSALKLFDKHAYNYFMSGGGFSTILKQGKIDATFTGLAFKIADTCKKLDKHIEYAFEGTFMLNIKNVCNSSDQGSDHCLDKIFKKKNILPKISDPMNSKLPLLKEIVGLNAEQRYRKSALKFEEGKIYK